MNILNLFQRPQGYMLVPPKEVRVVRRQMINNWKGTSVPKAQLDRSLARNYWRIDSPVHKAALDLIRKTLLKNPSVLEVGCSSGYYSDIFKESGLKVRYQGCDYSSAFIRLAKKLHPRLEFKVSDAMKLDYKSRSVDIVFASGVILAVSDYKKAIKESARVAKKYVIFHRNPVICETETSYAIQQGYGTTFLDTIFNETELFDLFRQEGLSVVAVNTHASMDIKGISEPVLMKSYLCKL